MPGTNYAGWGGGVVCLFHHVILMDILIFKFFFSPSCTSADSLFLSLTLSPFHLIHINSDNGITSNSLQQQTFLKQMRHFILGQSFIEEKGFLGQLDTAIQVCETQKNKMIKAPNLGKNS